MKLLSFLVVGCTVLLLSVGYSGCYYDKAQLLYPQTSCDSATATYTKTIVPALNQYCTSCHTGSTASGSVALDSYANVKIYVNNGRLMGTINQASGYSAMPKNSAKLDACSIAKFNHWISAGALNN